jgi:hypothetical protein
LKVKVDQKNRKKVGSFLVLPEIDDHSRVLFTCIHVNRTHWFDPVLSTYLIVVYIFMHMYAFIHMYTHINMHINSHQWNALSRVGLISA